jgi:hypothetical protein
MVLLVYQAGALENRDEVVKITVDIADCDYGLPGFRRDFRRFRPRQHPR